MRAILANRRCANVAALTNDMMSRVSSLDSVEPASSKKSRQANVSTRMPMFIELCAGSAVFSATAKARGYQVLAVDCPRNRHSPHCKITTLDLSIWDRITHGMCSGTLWKNAHV